MSKCQFMTILQRGWPPIFVTTLFRVLFKVYCNTFYVYALCHINRNPNRSHSTGAFNQKWYLLGEVWGGLQYIFPPVPYVGLRIEERSLLKTESLTM